jgi:TonB family protein
MRVRHVVVLGLAAALAAGAGWRLWHRTPVTQAPLETRPALTRQRTGAYPASPTAEAEGDTSPSSRVAPPVVPPPAVPPMVKHNHPPSSAEQRSTPTSHYPPPIRLSPKAPHRDGKAAPPPREPGTPPAATAKMRLDGRASHNETTSSSRAQAATEREVAAQPKTAIRPKTAIQPKGPTEAHPPAQSDASAWGQGPEHANAGNRGTGGAAPGQSQGDAGTASGGGAGSGQGQGDAGAASGNTPDSGQAGSAVGEVAPWRENPSPPVPIHKLIGPRVISSPGMDYPGAAFRMTVRRQEFGSELAIEGSEGIVGLRVLVSADGTVKSVGVETSSGSPVLDQTAAGAVRRWRFAPATRDGAPIDSFVTIRIRYVVR